MELLRHVRSSTIGLHVSGREASPALRAPFEAVVRQSQTRAGMLADLDTQLRVAARELADEFVVGYLAVFPIR